MAKPIKFAHVVFQTRRFEEMIAWYEGVFEARVVYRNSSLAFLTYDDEHHRFAFTRLPDSEPDDDGVRARGDAGVHHLAYTYANLGDLLETYARLKQSGVMPYWPIHHGMTLSLYYQDPDGNRLEFQVDACTVEKANAYIRQGERSLAAGGAPNDERKLSRTRAGPIEPSTKGRIRS
jgi:catechol-2,3-dioxygenase